MATQRVKLTANSLDRIKPRDTEYLIADSDLAGLYVRVYPSGRKVFLFYRRVAGKVRRKTIGDVGMMPVEQARQKVIELAQRYVEDGNASGGNFEVPSLEKSLSPTVERAMQLYHQAGVRKGLRTVDERTKELRLAMDGLLDRPMDQINDDEMQEHFRSIEGEKTPGRAAKFHTLTNTFFKWARYERMLRDNPMDMVKKPSGYKSKDRYLSIKECGLVYASAGLLSPAFRDVVRLLLLTGQRRGEIAQSLKEEYDLAEAVLKLSAERTKNGRAHEVPLGPVALSIVNQWMPGCGDYLFGTPRSYKGPLGWSKLRLVECVDQVRTVYNAPLSKARRMRAPEAFTIHDLRRTVGTQWIEELKAAPHVVEKQLNHTPPGIAGVYQRQKLVKERAELTRSWEHVILSAAKPFENAIEKNCVPTQTDQDK